MPEKVAVNGAHPFYTNISQQSVVVAAVVGGLVSVVVLGAALLLLWKACKARRNKATAYEQILSEHRSQSLSVETGIPATTVSMKQIPFTVPSQTPPSASRRVDDATLSGGSETTSPTGGKRPSVEIPGAYALGSIDPSLYRIRDEDDDYVVCPDHIGRVWFAVEYERETEKLLVTLIKAKNLPSRTQGSDNSCDPFVRIHLMPDERRYLQSKFRKKTCNPKFEESFVFQVSYRSIQDRVLKLTVYDVDRHKRHRVIGHALYALREHDVDCMERVVVWRDLEREVAETTSDRGEVLVSLTYNNHLERLTVGVFEAKGLKKTDGSSGIDSYFKVSLLIQNKAVKTKKTEVARKTDCPSFNESFTFKLPVSALDSASVNLSAMQYMAGHKDRTLGRIVLGSFMFARGKELDHWNEMVANQRDQVTHWHTLA